MDINKKIEIITDFATEHLDIKFEDEELCAFFDLNDLGVPYAIGVTKEYLTLTKAGEEIINSTWESLCKYMNLNSAKEFEDYEDFMEEPFFDD